MENATEALMMAFAVLVLIMALTMAFMLITQARSTADVIFTAKDDQYYVEDITSIGQQRDGAGNLIQYRIVGLDTIVPTIYRYAQENYGVIIIDSNNIVGIYDLIVENTVSKYSPTWNGANVPQQIIDICLGNDAEGVKGLADYIKETYGQIPTNADTMPEFKDLFDEIYHIEEPTSIQCPWTSSTYNIMQRLKVDMNGVSSATPHEFGDGTLKYIGAFYDANPNQNGFIKKYEGATFKEYYYNVKTTNNLTEEEETERLQIIYVKE